MSRIGKNPVAIPSGVTAQVANDTFSVKGKLGQLSVPVHEAVEVTVEGNLVHVKPKNESKQARAMWGTTRARINNAVAGVNEGFTVNLEINGVGYRAAMQGKNLQLSLGFSHDVVYQPPEGISIACPKPTEITVSGIDKQVVGQVAAEIREYRGPEPYKGKGVKYAGERIVRKEGKKK